MPIVVGFVREITGNRERAETITKYSFKCSSGVCALLAVLFYNSLGVEVNFFLFISDEGNFYPVEEIMLNIIV